MKPIIQEHEILVPNVFSLPLPVTSDLNYSLASVLVISMILLQMSG